jgi:hypothetical protein
MILLTTVYWFLHILLPQARQRLVAFLLVCLSSGLGWLMLIGGLSSLLPDMPTDTWVSESITFLTLLIMPHYALATSLMLVAFGGMLLAFQGERWGPACVAALACFVLGWVHPFSLLIIWAVSAAYLAWQTLRQRQVPWRQIGQFSLCLVCSLPVVLFLQFGVIQPSPAFRGWMEQNVLPSPGPLSYLLGYGLLLPLALLGIWRLVRRQELIDPLPLVWVVVAALLLYAPMAVQRRFVEGMHIPVCVLAALGWTLREEQPGDWKAVRLVPRSLLIAGLTATNMVVWISLTSVAVGQQHPYFIHNYEAEAYSWLDAHSEPDDTVLSSHRTGNFVPAWAGNRVVTGHWAQTVRVKDKQRDVQRFFAAATPAELRQEIVQKHGVVYLFHGPNERNLGDYDPSNDPLWELAFNNGHIAIYRSSQEAN